MQHEWKGSKEVLLAQLVRLVEKFIRLDKMVIHPPLFYQDELRRRLIITLNMTKVVQHILEAIRLENTEKLEPVFDRDHPIRSTSDMRTWYTGKPCHPTKKSHINFCVYDSTWEASDAYVLEHNPLVDAWVKNDHLGFEIFYVYRGLRLLALGCCPTAGRHRGHFDSPHAVRTGRLKEHSSGEIT